MAEKDEQYLHQEKPENWKIGSEIFERRKKELFKDLGKKQRFN
jgi:hypothetical protein